MSAYARLSIICITLLLSSGCITNRLWRWAKQPIRRSYAEGVVHDKDGSDRVYFSYINCKGFDPDTYYEVKVPADWQKSPISSFQDEHTLKTPLVPAPSKKLWETLDPMTTRVHARKVRHVTRLVKRAPRAPPGRTPYALVRHKSDDGQLVDDLYGYSDDRRRWVRLSRMELGYGARKGGRKFVAALLTPFTVIVDIPIVIVLGIGIGLRMM